MLIVCGSRSQAATELAWWLRQPGQRAGGTCSSHHFKSTVAFDPLTKQLGKHEICSLILDGGTSAVAARQQQIP